MKGGSPRNASASVRQRLLNKARADKRPFNELLQDYAMGRFLYRLSCSRQAGRFVLKGALMLRVWESPTPRTTMDIDLLGRTSNREVDLTAQVREILSTEVDPDGLAFDADSLRLERIMEDAVDEGLRLRLTGSLDTARITLQIDIGFGDPVYPHPQEADFPGLLDFPVPRLLCYSRESTIAEKFEAMVKLGELNSRMKDFYDIWLLSRQFDFIRADLAEAIRLTFARRHTEVPETVAAFTAGFGVAKQRQWMAFHRRLQQHHVPTGFAEIIAGLDSFLAPIGPGLRSGHIAPGAWNAPGPWRNPAVNGT